MGENSTTLNSACSVQNHERDIGPLGITIKTILVIITVVGNLATIIIILAKRKLRKELGNRFILSLSVADFCVGLFVMLPYIFKSWVCKDSS